jgi:KDO2-lipid IV(A) lauroyltransferase
VTESPAEKTIVSNLTNITFGLWFPFFRWMARTVPPVWVARLASVTVEQAVWRRGHVHEAICSNVAQVLGVPATDPRVEKAARTMVSRHSRSWIDLLRCSGRNDIAPEALLARRIGDEQLAAAHREGTGAILLTAHVGNFELGGLFLREMGITTYAVYAPDPSPVVEAHRESARRSLGVIGIPVTSSPFASVPILRALRSNGFVAMQGDRDVSGTGRRLPFFGKTASFPVGPFRIAQASGAPLFPVFVLQEDDGRYRTVVEPPIRVTHIRGSREADESALAAAMERFVGTLTRTIRENPTQWYLFTPFWEDGG